MSVNGFVTTWSEKQKQTNKQTKKRKPSKVEIIELEVH